jgi:hypothetical protein
MIPAHEMFSKNKNKKTPESMKTSNEMNFFTINSP